jgi:hypothetical protein
MTMKYVLCLLPLLFSGCSALLTAGEKIEVSRQLADFRQDTVDRTLKDVRENMGLILAEKELTPETIAHLKHDHEREDDIPWEDRGGQGILLAMVADRLNERRKAKKAAVAD